MKKTHFVRAHKLAQDGNRSVLDQGKRRILWSEADTEGSEILRMGPLCVIYKQGLYKDKAAAKALASEG